jgi:hypothetical protein
MVALNADGSTILQAAFDESRGTGAGYDTLYASVRSSATSGRVQTVAGQSRRLGSGMRCDFSAIKVNVPYGNGAVRMSYPCEVTFTYQKRVFPVGTGSRTVQRSLGTAPRTQESFAASSVVILRQGSEQWHYSFSGTIKPSQSLENAPVWSFLQRPAITITTRPDGRTSGNLGIGLRLAAGGNEFQCKKGSIPAKAHVEIKTGDGRIVHRGSGPLDAFTFG